MEEYLIAQGYSEVEVEKMSPLLRQQLYYQQPTKRVSLYQTKDYRALVEEIHKTKTQLSLEELPDGLFKCRCGSRKTTYVQRQIRRADEGMTTLVTCHKCKRSWRGD